MKRLLGLVVFGLVGCAPEKPYDGPTPYLLDQEEISRVFVHKHLVPNVMVLADRSSAMAGARLTQLQESLSELLSQSGRDARWGLTTFPTPTVLVELPPADDADDASVLTANAAAVNDALQPLTTDGATQTLAALQFTGASAALNQAADPRADVIVLLTGGAPAGDAQATIDLIEKLHSEQEIVTIVVAFSPEAASEATFNAMARAGGVPRRCGFDGELCPRAFYDETTVASLFEVFEPLELTPTSCVFFLATTPEFLAVTLDDVTLSEGVDTYTVTDSRVQLVGAACERVQNATARNPAHLVIRAVNKQ